MIDFSELYSQQKDRIFGFAYRMTGNVDDAEDICQETFLSAYRKLDQFRGESQPSTWLFTIARNISLRYLQKRKKNSIANLEALINSAADPDAACEYPDHEKRFLIQQVREGCLTGLLRCLSLTQRTAFILFVLLDYSIAETAGIIGKSTGATKVLIYRARKNIKTFLCKNCSLYQSDNPCRCENLIKFSLAQGWISKSLSNPELSVDVNLIEDEINDIRKLTLLYKNLENKPASPNLEQKIRALIDQKEHNIFCESRL